MKVKVLLYLLILSFTLSCAKDKYLYIKALNNISACGKNDPLNQLEWLNTKILNGKDPANTNFIENLWIKTYMGKDIIVIDFGLTSSMYSTFDCSGKSITISDQDFFDSLSEDVLIYKNVIES
jgi:hypothetical protein